MCTVAPDTMYPTVSSVRCSPSIKGLPTASTNSYEKRKTKDRERRKAKYTERHSESGETRKERQKEIEAAAVGKTTTFLLSSLRTE